jgi:poly(beta-D-mannuronate) lyase
MRYTKSIILFFLICCLFQTAFAIVYTVNNKTDLQNRMTAAMPADTVIVANGTYNWGQINFTNTNNTNTGAWIVLKAETLGGVVFTGSTYLQFRGIRIEVNGFTFRNGNAGTNAVIAFRASSNNNATYSRITNITIDNYNTLSVDTSTENEWVGLFGIYNRIDHCTFINKINPRATVVVWYSSTTYPNPSVSTYHKIDSNYFFRRTYMGDNGGETIRVGDSNTSRTDGFNIIEYNLFEGLTQAEPEIVSNKSDFNTYRYNTFLNSNGGLTLRHGRYCNVYGNYFIRNADSITQDYGIRIIDRGHKVYNNYFENLTGNSGGGTSQNRAVISVLNGVSTDTTDASFANRYFPADTAIIAFNTIINTRGGGAINLGGTLGGTITPKGVVIANNIIRAQTGSIVFSNTANTNLTFTAEGNVFQAPSGLGISATGFTAATITTQTRSNGILLPQNSLVQDAAINSTAYNSFLNGLDIQQKTRTGFFDIGCVEINNDNVLYTPLDSTKVGAGKALVLLPLQNFLLQQEHNQLLFTVSANNQIQQYIVQKSRNGVSFSNAYTITAIDNATEYSVPFVTIESNVFYRVMAITKTASIVYSNTIRANESTTVNIRVYPNPFNQFLFIQSPNNIVQSVKIYNTVGVLVGSVYKQNLIPTANLLKGLYHIKIHLSNNKIVTKTVNKL